MASNETLPIKQGASSKLERAAAEFDKRFAAGDDVVDLTTARSAIVSDTLIELWPESLTDDACLLAVGGFGRGELFPQSDIDLLILIDSTKGESLETDRLISDFITQLWDVGLTVGHSVRTMEQTVTLAASDISVMTNLLENRFLVGASHLHRQLESALSGELHRPEEFFAAKLAEQNARHERFGDTAYNLEPNLKDGPGGLRDVHTVVWIAMVEFGIDSLKQIEQTPIMDGEEIVDLIRNRDVLARLRYALHLEAGRPEDRLLFQHQRSLADRLGYQDGHHENLAVEQLMQDYFRAVKSIEWFNWRAMRFFSEHYAPTSATDDVEVLDEAFQIRGGLIELRKNQCFEQSAERMMRLFLWYSEHPDVEQISARTAASLRQAVATVSDEELRSDAARQSFVAILRSSGDIARTLIEMHRHTLLGRYLPPFGRIVGRMQYDLFHVYTVDQHTLEVMKRFAQFSRGADFDNFPLVGQVMARIGKPDLLFLAGIFHDIAKGRGGDHSELGADEAQRFCDEHQLPAADTDLVVWLVRHHLLMSITAQKRDINDPDVINEFAAVIGSRQYLDHLYLLTVADISATSPKLWNSWKATLLKELYRSTRLALNRGFANPAQRLERINSTRRQAAERLQSSGMAESEIAQLWGKMPTDYFLRHGEDQIIWHTHLRSRSDELPVIGTRNVPARGSTELVVYAPNRDGTFASILAVLSQMGLSIIDARATNTDDDRILDSFQVLDHRHQPIDDPDRQERLRQAIADVLTRPSELLKSNRHAPPPHRLAHFRRPTDIRFVHEDDRFTEMELVGSDRPGLLADVALVLLKRDVRVHGARVATFGERVEDFFLLTDMSDQPLTEEKQKQVAEELKAVLDEAAAEDDLLPAR